MNASGFNDLAPEERSLLQDSILDLSGASEFYKKYSRIASKLCEHVKQVTEDRYELSPQLLESILAVRRMQIGTGGMQPADRLARALFNCARSLTFGLRFQTRPKAEAWSEYFDAVEKHGPVHLRAKRRLFVAPVSTDGTVLEPFSRPDLPELRIEFAFNTELAHFSWGGEVRSYEIPELFENDTTAEKSHESEEIIVQRLPELSIRIEGAPVTKMMIATFDRSGADIDLAKACTVKMLNGVMNELKRT